MGDARILESGTATPSECLRYALSLPTSTVVTGIDSRAVLEQDLEIARTFRPLAAAEREDLLARTADAARSGGFEKFKTTNAFDSTALYPEWLGAPDERSA